MTKKQFDYIVRLGVRRLRNFPLIQSQTCHDPARCTLTYKLLYYKSDLCIERMYTIESLDDLVGGARRMIWADLSDDARKLYSSEKETSHDRP